MLNEEKIMLELAKQEAFKIVQIEDETRYYPSEDSRFNYDPPGYARGWDASVIQKNMVWMGLAERFWHVVTMTLIHGGKKKRREETHYCISSDSIRLTTIGRKFLLSEVPSH